MQLTVSDCHGKQRKETNVISLAGAVEAGLPYNKRGTADHLIAKNNRCGNYNSLSRIDLLYIQLFIPLR